MKKLLFAVLVVCSSLLQANETITVSGRDGATQSGLLIEADNAKAVALLFPGGSGFIKLKPDGSFKKLTGNFLLRSRGYFLDKAMHVVIMDAPSDHQDARGMKFGFRSSAEHVQDIAAMVMEMKQRYHLPVWLIGTSRGTESVANAMVKLNTGIAGAVLTASMTELNDGGSSVLEFDLEKVSIPVMVASHTDDACWVTPPAGAQRIGKALTASSRLKVQLFSGGDEPVSEPCKAKSQHGFYGIEKEVVDAIATFILNRR
jgi:hypothetical protein